MPWYGLFASVTGLALAGLLWAEWARSPRARWICKPVASAGFIAAALSGGAPTGGFGWAIVTALALSFAGDVLLIPRATAWFAAGLASFLFGHLGFAAAFLLRGVSPAWVLGALLVVGAVAFGVHRWLRPHVPPQLRGPVLAYILVISLMVALAWGTFGHRPDARAALLLGAAIAFFFSDLAVARNRFVAEGLVNRLWGLPLYYGAQLAFAWALVGAV
jgi:uncharacterized membrane protein YhhN